MNARRARRRKHEKRLLRDYRTGGVQITALRQIVRDARADGLRPFLCALPVTELHRDTDHLHRSASRELSIRLAREAVLPLLGD